VPYGNWVWTTKSGSPEYDLVPDTFTICPVAGCGAPRPVEKKPEWCTHISTGRNSSGDETWFFGTQGNEVGKDWTMCPICQRPRPSRFVPKELPKGVSPVPLEFCVCGHPRYNHIYDEGACRPGWVCKECTEYKQSPLCTVSVKDNNK